LLPYRRNILAFNNAGSHRGDVSSPDTARCFRECARLQDDSRSPRPRGIPSLIQKERSLIMRGSDESRFRAADATQRGATRSARRDIPIDRDDEKAAGIWNPRARIAIGHSLPRLSFCLVPPSCLVVCCDPLTFSAAIAQGMRCSFFFSLLPR
jgi:hypothetical protein